MGDWPKQLRFQKQSAQLVVNWDNGEDSVISFRTLRAHSPSAQNAYTDKSEVPNDITVLKADIVGRYAARIHFSDGHDTGLYRWGLLAQLGHEELENQHD